MYRNVAYLSKDRVVRLFTWDEDGNRVSYDVPHEPYYYVETKSAPDAMSLYNTPLKKVEFRDEYARQSRIKELRRRLGDGCDNIRLFENVSILQQFLTDRYWEQNDSPDFTRFPIKVLTM